MGGSLDLNEILDITTINGNCECFVEGGTYMGATAQMCSKIFSEVHTVEICTQLYTDVIKTSINFPNCFFYLGDTVDWFPKLAKRLKDKRVFWFLDAHISGSDSSHNPEHPVPLLNEIEIILKETSPNIGTIIVVDDIRDCNSYHWSNINAESIQNILKQYFPKAEIYCKNDRMIINITG